MTTLLTTVGRFVTSIAEADAVKIALTNAPRENARLEFFVSEEQETNVELRVSQGVSELSYNERLH